MRILIVGFGSIGQRHAKILQGLDGVEVGLLRRPESVTLPAGRNEFSQVEQAMAFEPDGVIVCNPTALHTAGALPFLMNGIPTLIEKPIAHTINEALRLSPYAQLIRVAYVLRFSIIRDMLEELRREGGVFELNFTRSYHLPNWHRAKDYRLEYVAKSELGGGCARTLSHEIDLVLSLFGMSARISGYVDKLSDLEIDTDDCAFISMRYSGGPRVNIKLDLFTPINVFEGVVQTTYGTFQWNLRGSRLLSRGGENYERERSFPDNLIDLAYEKQIHDFIRFIRTGESIAATLEDSVNVLKVIEAIDD